MIAGLPMLDVAWLAIALLVAGAITGFLAGLFGVGGGAVLVPALYELFRFAGVPDDVRMPLCVGTSLAIIIPTSIRSYYAHRATRAVDTTVLRNWAVPVVIGVVVGSFIARYAPAELFKIVFVAIAGISAVRLLFGRDSWRFADDMPKGFFLRAYGGVIGVLSTLMGIGGGQLSNLFMTFYGRPIHQAIATSSGLGVLISIPGAIGYIYAGWPAAAANPDVLALQLPFALGYVSLIATIIVAPTSVLTAPLGVKLAHALPKRALEISFGIFLLLVCSRFFVSLF
ncbi:MAG TPA: sulfite exporter TauE/SafE family protein [Xanthobacteraceae bacterium]|nr:sulfite exporter TauE/SafE family protein [Xanthobacteraceae bacterium]